MENKTQPRPSLLARYLPILGWLPKYERSWLRTDLIAGLTVVALLIPEGMAYAQIAGMPPQTAFYAAPIGLLAFAIFGTSRQLVVAVSAIIATMSFATVSLIVAPNTPEFILLTAALAVLAGLISILCGFLKLGRVAQFFSESVMVGFLTGLALTVMIKQVPKLLGIEGGSGNFWERLYDVIIHLPETHRATLVTGILCLILLIVLEHYFHKIPAALVALIFGIAISVIFGLEARGVEIVGEIPAGLAPPQWPAVGLQNWWLLFPGALGLALVNFAEAIGPSRSFAAAHKYKMDANQELIGLGAANLGAGLFQGFPIGSSLSKSAANDRAGAHSQMSGIIAAVVTVVGGALLYAALLRLTRSSPGGDRHRGRIGHGQSGQDQAPVPCTPLRFHPGHGGAAGRADLRDPRSAAHRRDRLPVCPGLAHQPSQAGCVRSRTRPPGIERYPPASRK